MATDVEHEIKTIPIDENFQATIDQLIKDGWQLVPGAQPIAIYHLARSKQTFQMAQAPSAGAALGDLSIDDSKIGILRNGKMIS